MPQQSGEIGFPLDDSAAMETMVRSVRKESLLIDMLEFCKREEKKNRSVGEEVE
jgi:hypothetical protein